jgi:hypothetical protein
MADDKIVTKKTAAKKTETKKTTALKSQVPESSPPLAAPSKTTESAPARKSTPRATSKKTSTAKAPTPKRGQSGVSAAPKPLSDHQGSLRQLATVAEEKRQDMIREAAYYKAEKRRFAPGHEAEDWAAAEREIDELIARARVMTGH